MENALYSPLFLHPLILTIRVPLGFLKQLSRKDLLHSNSGMTTVALNLNIRKIDNGFSHLYPAPSVVMTGGVFIFPRCIFYKHSTV